MARSLTHDEAQELVRAIVAAAEPQCSASSPIDGIADRCLLPQHFSGEHVGVLHTWDPIEEGDADLLEEYRPWSGEKPDPTLTLEDVLVAPPSAKVVR